MKTKSEVAVLKQLPIEAPPLLAEALTDDLFNKVRMQRYPVLILDPVVLNHDESGWRGFCPFADFTEAAEIVMSAELFDVRSARLRKNQIQEIKNVYLHECAHRLTQHRIKQGRWHNAAFLAVNLLLHLRVGGCQLNQVRVYDFHQEQYFKEAFSWAYEIASEFADSDLTAEKASEVILDRYDEWLSWMDGADARVAKAEEERQQVIRQKKASANRIRILEQDRYLIAGVCLIVGFLARFVK